MSEIDAYKIFRQLEERKKRENPYKFYDKDELIDEILKLEDKLQQKENIIKEVRKKLIKSKEYQAVKSLDFNSKMSILIELEEILDKGE